MKVQTIVDFVGTPEHDAGGHCLPCQGGTADGYGKKERQHVFHARHYRKTIRLIQWSLRDPASEPVSVLDDAPHKSFRIGPSQGKEALRVIPTSGFLRGEIPLFARDFSHAGGDSSSLRSFGMTQRHPLLSPYPNCTDRLVIDPSQKPLIGY